MGLLDAKRALVTGGTTGLGLAIAERFRREGAQVVITASLRQQSWVGVNESRVWRLSARLGYREHGLSGAVEEGFMGLAGGSRSADAWAEC